MIEMKSDDSTSDKAIVTYLCQCRDGPDSKFFHHLTCSRKLEIHKYTYTSYTYIKQSELVHPSSRISCYVTFFALRWT